MTHQLLYEEQGLGFCPPGGCPTKVNWWEVAAQAGAAAAQAIAAAKQRPQPGYPPGYPPYQSPGAPPERQPAPAADEEEETPTKKKSSGGFGLNWDNEGLHIGDSITLSPTMLILIVGAIVLMQMRPVGRR